MPPGQATYLSDAQYVRREGEVCPVCEARAVEQVDAVVGGGEVHNRVGCGACGSRWTGTYRLTGYTDLHNALQGALF